MLQIKRQDIRKGMVLAAQELNPSATWEFDADVLVLHHPTTISSRYQAMGKYNFFTVDHFCKEGKRIKINLNKIELARWILFINITFVDPETETSPFWKQGSHSAKIQE